MSDRTDFHAYATKWRSTVYWCYGLVVVIAAVFVAIRATWDTPATGRSPVQYMPVGWQPSWILISFLCGVVLSLAFAVKWPIGGTIAYLLVEHSLRRYGPELEYVYTRHLPEIIALLGFLGVCIWWATNAPLRKPCNKLLIMLMAMLFAWSLVSTLRAVLQFDITDFEIRHHPLRYFDGMLLCLSAAMSVRQRREFLLLTGTLAGAITCRVVVWPDTLLLDGDVAQLMAVSIPLLMGTFIVIASRPVKLLPGSCVVCFIGLLIRLQNRGAVVACVFSMFAMWLQSFRRWTVLFIAVPLLLLAAICLRESGLASRLAGSLPGGTTYDSVHSRLVLWQSAWEMSIDHWLLGVGPGNFPVVSQAYQSNTDLIVAHNNFLTVLAELGVPGLVLYLSLLATAIYAMWRVGRQSPIEWPSPECRAIVGAIIAHIAAGCFITRHDQALLFILVGVASALTAKPTRTGAGVQDRNDVQDNTLAEVLQSS